MYNHCSIEFCDYELMHENEPIMRAALCLFLQRNMLVVLTDNGSGMIPIIFKVKT